MGWGGGLRRCSSLRLLLESAGRQYNRMHPTFRGKSHVEIHYNRTILERIYRRKRFDPRDNGTHIVGGNYLEVEWGIFLQECKGQCFNLLG